jgi:hypothetical protein
MADMDGQRRTLSALENKGAMFTTNEVIKLFEQNGLPRTQRSIERYCHHGKLDCFLEPDEGRYYITQESTERLIGHFQEIQARHGMAAAVGGGRTASDDAGQATPSRDREAEEPETHRDDPEEKKRIAELEYKMRDMEITNRMKDMYIEKMEKERERLIDRVTESAHQIGVLETKLLQLEAPKERREDPPERGEGAREEGYRGIPNSYREENGTRPPHEYAG